MKDRFSTKSESMKSATALLPMSTASIRSFAMLSLAATPKDKKYTSLYSKLEQKGLVKPETASFYFASEQIEYLISVHFRVVSIN